MIQVQPSANRKTKQLIFLLIICSFIINSCSPKVSTSFSKKYPAIDYREEVRVFDLQDPIPSNPEELGVVKIGDTGFTTNCGYTEVIEKAKTEARSVGGNALKITKHTLPSVWGSSCHQITATILKVDHFDQIPASEVVDSSLIHANYALLHIYRPTGAGALVSYDLHLGDTVICRVNNNWKKTLKIRKDGLNTLWARTEVKDEIPIEIKFGNEYYIRCGITMGAFVGHPQLELVDKPSGKAEFQSIKRSRSDNKDIILLNDGRQIECLIDREDDQKVYFTILKDRKKIKTEINKSQIKSIERAE
ncbi:MAG TPA: hypothetical protein PKH79_08160 [Prolixibacteraceae bacterium]|nr:hypothetical protein [Prolixibacteraceae bacterium]